jgi:hypothetical protein
VFNGSSYSITLLHLTQCEIELTEVELMDVSVKSTLIGDRLMLVLSELIIFQCTVFRVEFES